MSVVRSSVEARGCRASALAVLGALAMIVPGCIPPSGGVATARLLPSSGLVQNRRDMTYTPNVSWWSLPNGLAVMFAPDPQTNVVRVDLRVMVGAADEPPRARHSRARARDRRLPAIIPRSGTSARNSLKYSGTLRRAEFFKN